MPRQTFSHTAVAATSPERVWATLDEPRTWESIGGIDRVFDSNIDASGRLQGFGFDTEVAGKKYRGMATPHRREEGQAMAWNVRNSEIMGTLDVELGPAGDNTQITVTLDVESLSFMSGMFFPVIAGAIGNGLGPAVDKFASSFD